MDLIEQAEMYMELPKQWRTDLEDMASEVGDEVIPEYLDALRNWSGPPPGHMDRVQQILDKRNLIAIWLRGDS